MKISGVSKIKVTRAITASQNLIQIVISYLNNCKKNNVQITLGKRAEVVCYRCEISIRRWRYLWKHGKKKGEISRVITFVYLKQNSPLKFINNYWKYMDRL